MKRKHFIALFCLLVLGMQVLPAKQIGAMLFGNQMNEEVPHCLEASKDGLAKLDFSKSDPFILQDYSYGHLLTNSPQEYIHFTTSLPGCHYGEIPTPPPNVII